MVGAQQILSGGASQPIGHVHFLIGIRGQLIGKDRHHHKDQDDHPTEGPQRLLLEQPDEEIRKPASLLGLFDGGGNLGGVAHVLYFSILRSLWDSFLQSNLKPITRSKATN